MIGRVCCDARDRGRIHYLDELDSNDWHSPDYKLNLSVKSTPRDWL
jgi:hypothetical protein